jgi:hypothetical protein
MRTYVKILELCVASSLLVSCASLNYVHDPQFGIVDRSLLPSLIKSLRCELVTFYTANRRRQQDFAAYARRDPNISVAKTDRDFALARFAHFGLDDALYGVMLLHLKVVDTLNAPASNTAITSKHVTDPTHSKTWHVGPTASGVHTNEFQWFFTVPQNSTLTAPLPVLATNFAPSQASAENEFRCFSELTADFDGLARGDYRELERFKRVYVNGTLPLAGWLQNNSEVMATAVLTAKESDSEAIIPSQMYHSFSLQVSGGVNARFSLLSPQWNPLAIEAAASVQQTNNVQFYINGAFAPTALGARAGASFNSDLRSKPSIPRVRIEGPVKVIIDDKKDMFLVPDSSGPEKKVDEKAKKKTVEPSRQPIPRSLQKDPGGFIFGPAIVPPGPSQ